MRIWLRVIGVSTLLVLSLGMMAVAAPISKPAKTVEVNLVVSADEVLVGQKATLEATTIKKGSNYNITWSGAQEDTTVLNADGEWVSTATFQEDEAGSYDVTCTVIMSAGKSHVYWVGSATESIMVIEPEKEKSNNGNHYGQNGTQPGQNKTNKG